MTEPARRAPDAVFRDLCLDASDPMGLARFWGGVLHREVHLAEDGFPYLTGDGGVRDGGLTWIDAVPEPRTGKTRVHLDVRLPSPDPSPVLDLGANLVRAPDDEVRWWVLADPEGNEFCAFPPAPPEWNAAVERPTPFELVVDCTDPDAIAAWWAARLGATVGSRDGARERWLADMPGFPYRFWVFAPVPEPRTVKNRLHWDLVLRDPDPAAFLSAGARLLRSPDDEIRWWILADPEGNEFCTFPPDGPA